MSLYFIKKTKKTKLYIFSQVDQMTVPATSHDFASVALHFDSRGRALPSLSLILHPSVML